MPPATTVLESRSQSQALDWSLVLISQGIESLIQPHESDGVWTLEVAEEERPRALAAIAAYERENKTVWRREVKGTGLLFDVRAAVWFALLALFYLFATTSPVHFRAAGLADRTAILHGEWWRLFTAVTLHADLAHLAANAATGFVFLGLAMACFGPGVAVLLSFLGGALGNVATCALHPDEPFRSLGASGMVMASLGLLTAHAMALARHEKRTVWIGRGVIAGGLLLVLLGSDPRSDVVAHVGGFLAGLLLGVGAMRFRKIRFKRALNLSATLACAALVLFTWWRALR